MFTLLLFIVVVLKEFKTKKYILYKNVGHISQRTHCVLIRKTQ